MTRSSTRPRSSTERVDSTPTGKPVTHGGSGAAYAHYGCRCDECCEANTARVERRRKERDARLGEFEHNASGYSNWGCRCDACSAAHAEKMQRGRDDRFARRAAGYTDFKHGRNGYNAWGCRCDTCRAGIRVLSSIQVEAAAETEVLK